LLIPIGYWRFFGGLECTYELRIRAYFPLMTLEVLCPLLILHSF
jgi:hypothetical protein